MEPTLPLRAQIVAVIGCVLFLFFVLELVRRRRLREEYSILWMAVSVALAVLAVWDGLLLAITRAVGAFNANSVIFFFGLLFLLTVVLHLTVRVSELSETNKNLTQALALLEARLHEKDPARRS